jgi:hypothetical protein
MRKLKTTIIASGLSALLALTAFAPAGAAPLTSGPAIQGQSDIKFVDWRRHHGNDWRGNDRRDWHGDNHRSHHNNAGAIIGGLAAGAIIGGAIANGNRNRYHRSHYYYQDR